MCAHSFLASLCLGVFVVSTYGARKRPSMFFVATKGAGPRAAAWSQMPDCRAATSLSSAFARVAELRMASVYARARPRRKGQSGKISANSVDG